MTTLTVTVPPQDPLTDEEVVARVLAGETSMFEIVMRRYNQLLYRVARSILRNDSEDRPIRSKGAVTVCTLDRTADSPEMSHGKVGESYGC